MDWSKPGAVFAPEKKAPRRKRAFSTANDVNCTEVSVSAAARKPLEWKTFGKNAEKKYHILKNESYTPIKDGGKQVLIFLMIVGILISILGCFMEGLCELSEGGIRTLFDVKSLHNNSLGILIFIAIISFIPIIIPLLACLGVSHLYDFAKYIMASTAPFLFIYYFTMTDNGPKPNKVLLLMEIVPSIITIIVLVLRALLGYLALPKPIWIVIEVTYVIAKFLLLMGIGQEDK